MCNNTSFSAVCCPNHTFVQDKVCTPWSGTVVNADVLIVTFANNLYPNIVGTGYLKLNVGPADISFNFLNRAGASINPAPLRLSLGTSVAFTYRGFNVIQIALPGAIPGTYHGEFCITTRYPVY